jgi:hypothetical protein
MTERPADPPSPLTARRAIARAIADSRKAFGVLRPDDLMDALEGDGFMVVPLASSPAPAGLDAAWALRRVKQKLTWMGGAQGIQISYHEAMQAVEAVEDEYVRAATRRAEDAG